MIIAIDAQLELCATIGDHTLIIANGALGRSAVHVFVWQGLHAREIDEHKSVGGTRRTQTTNIGCSGSEEGRRRPISAVAAAPAPSRAPR